MKFYAVVKTTTDAPYRPVLDDSWDATLVDDHPVGMTALQRSLAEALTDADTIHAAIVSIEVPDEQLRLHLGAMPLVVGVVSPPAIETPDEA